MKRLLLLAMLLPGSIFLYAQPAMRQPHGGGEYVFTPGACITPAQSAEISKALEANRKMLTALGILTPANAAQKTAITNLAWPLKQATGFNYYNLYGISNYVDHDLTYPGHIQDWNCGTRTYDQSGGYNHGGMDIFIWPFSQVMMAAQQAQIVAAAPGTILAKYDGNYDKNCSVGTVGSAQWNAVYIQHADGTVAWYGHMKSGSLTTKGIGQTVAVGEYLGSVGSSGNSSGPHLHFELHNASGVVIDPYNGPCSSNASMWQTQKPYYEPAINAVMTHSDVPTFPTCPNPELVYAKDTFLPGDLVYFASYYHDQQKAQISTHTILRPDNSVFDTWTSSLTSVDWYAASYWYWSYTLPAASPGGWWHYKINYQGNIYNHDFYVKGPLTVAGPTRSFSGSLYPVPAKDRLYISTGAPLERADVFSISGQHVAGSAIQPSAALALYGLPDGLYFLNIRYKDGHTEAAKFTVQQ